MMNVKGGMKSNTVVTFIIPHFALITFKEQPP